MGLLRANDETNNVNEHNMIKNPSWREADQLAIYKHDRGVGLGSTEKQAGLKPVVRRDLNPRPPDIKSGALTMNHAASPHAVLRSRRNENLKKYPRKSNRVEIE